MRPFAAASPMSATLHSPEREPPRVTRLDLAGQVPVRSEIDLSTEENALGLPALHAGRMDTEDRWVGGLREDRGRALQRGASLSLLFQILFVRQESQEGKRLAGAHKGQQKSTSSMLGRQLPVLAWCSPRACPGSVVPYLPLRHAVAVCATSKRSASSLAISK
jgi:hypothetical protein